MAETTEAQTSAGTGESQTADTQGASTATVSIFEADGKTFSKDWKNSLPEELRSEKSLDTFSDLPSAMKMLIHAQRKLGAEKIVKPTDKSTPEDWAEFYKEMGRPDAPEGYKIEVPKELAEIAGKETPAQLSAVFHEAGLSQKQADVVTAAYFKAAQGGMAAQKAAEEKAANDGLLELEKRWGTNKNANTAIVQRVLRENMTPTDAAGIEDAINRYPQFADLLASVGHKFMEGKAITADAESTGAGGLSEQIRTLRNTPGYMDGKMPANERAGIQEQLDALYKKAYPEK